MGVNRKFSVAYSYNTKVLRWHPQLFGRSRRLWEWLLHGILVGESWCLMIRLWFMNGALATHLVAKL